MNHQGCVGLYFRCLENLLKRGELDLNSLGFENKKPGKNRQRKLEIGLKYQKISYDILGQVLKKVLQKGLSDFHRKFIEFYLAHSYFRIPKFRMILLLSMENFITKNNVDKDDLYTRNQSVYDMPLAHARFGSQSEFGEQQGRLTRKEEPGFEGIKCLRHFELEEEEDSRKEDQHSPLRHH